MAILCSGLAMAAQQPSGPYGANGQSGYGEPQYADDEGYRRGFDDGMRSGQTDVQRGKRGDPTKSENYEDAPGYNSSYGDKGQWKQQYRQGYVTGYQRAMYGEANGEYGQRSYGQSGYAQPQYADDEGYRRGFDDGMRSGQTDVQRGKRGYPTKSENYEDAPGYNSSYGDKGQWKQLYREGYIAGYQQATGGGAGGYYGQRPSSQDGYYGSQLSSDDEGYRRGFDDGMRSGQTDVQRGKRGDPTKSENYEDAPGYNSSYGDKGQWKQQYRQGYVTGYQRAMYGETNGEYGQRP